MPKIDIGIVTTISARTAVDPVGEFGRRFSTSAAQSARTRWKSGSQRKLHRKTPAVGIIARTKMKIRRTSSQRILPQSARPFATNPASKAAGGTRPQASSVAPCCVSRDEKFDQFTVHDG